MLRPAGTPTPWPTGPGTPEPTPAGNAPGGQYAGWGIWPEPAGMVWVSNDSAITATLPASFSISCTTISGACPTPLANAAARYQRTILRFGAPNDGAYLSELELERASWTAIADRAEFIDVAAKRRGVRSEDLELWGEAYDSEFKEWAKVKAATPARWAASHRAGECAAEESPAAATTAVMTHLTVHVNSSADPPLTYDVDESYAMTIGATSAMIEAKTQWGAIRGLESFAQSVYCLPSASAEVAATNGSTAPCIYTLRNLPVSVNDAPRFKWRGVMVDTARHFLGVPSMKRIIDGMSMNKMNMLHWHATDDTSWSIESKLYPNFTTLGAYSTTQISCESLIISFLFALFFCLLIYILLFALYSFVYSGAYSTTQIYTTEIITALHAYAEERGVILYPEWDVPGHAQIWSKTYPEYTDTSCGGIDPTGRDGHDIFTVLAALAQEFGGDAIHFGGDEFNPASWTECTAVNAWAKAQGAPYVNSSGLIDYDIVRIHFEIQLSKLAAQQNKRAVFWQEAWQNGLGANSSMPLGAFDKSAIFTSWSGNDCSPVYEGYDVLMNTGWCVAPDSLPPPLPLSPSLPLVLGLARCIPLHFTRIVLTS